MGSDEGLGQFLPEAAKWFVCLRRCREVRPLGLAGDPVPVFGTFLGFCTYLT